MSCGRSKTRPDTRHKSFAVFVFCPPKKEDTDPWTDVRTDGPTDVRTDGQTDGDTL